MSRIYNYLSFSGNKGIELVLAETKRRMNAFREKEPTLFNQYAIASVFYGMSPIEFNSSSLPEVTKNLYLSYFSESETEIISGSSIPTDLQDYLTQCLAKVDPEVIITNYYNDLNGERGYYISLCRDAANGDFSIVCEGGDVYEEHDFSESQEESEDDPYDELHEMEMESYGELHIHAPWTKKYLKYS
jgi:hypothetical protein